MKYTILLVLAAVLSLSNCMAADSEPITNSSQVVNIVSSIKSWAESDSYTEADWNHLIDVARVIKQTDPHVVEEAMFAFNRACYATNTDYSDETKPYLLMRVLFDLPTNAPAADRFSFANFLTFRREENIDGTVNLSWPIGWKQGKPFFCSRYLGADGPPYEPDSEYAYMRAHFKYRLLNSAK